MFTALQTYLQKKVLARRVANTERLIDDVRSRMKDDVIEHKKVREEIAYRQTHRCGMEIDRSRDTGLKSHSLSELHVLEHGFHHAAQRDTGCLSRLEGELSCTLALLEQLERASAGRLSTT